MRSGGGERERYEERRTKAQVELTVCDGGRSEHAFRSVPFRAPCAASPN
jgi:hypothetical protein